jgi:hypothetical protein
MSQSLYLPIVATGFIAFGGYATARSGVSDEAVLLNDNFARICAHQESAESLFGVKSQLISDLREITAECAHQDWDGYGAQAVSDTVILRAEAFIRALPESIPAPEISAEPDGQISFDWLPSRTRTFTLSVNAGNRLAYAWIDGANRGNAAEAFERGTLPTRLLNELRYITADAPAVRIA